MADRGFGHSRQHAAARRRAAMVMPLSRLISCVTPVSRVRTHYGHGPESSEKHSRNIPKIFQIGRERGPGRQELATSVVSTLFSSAKGTDANS